MDFTVKSIPLEAAAKRGLSLAVIRAFWHDSINQMIVIITDKGAFHGDDPSTQLFFYEYKKFREQDTESTVILTPWMLDDGLTHTVRVIPNTD